MIKRTPQPAYTIDRKTIRRFDQRRNIFGRLMLDPTAGFYKTSMYRNVPQIVARGRKGYTRPQFAQAVAAWTVYDFFHGAFTRERLTGSRSCMGMPRLPRFRFATPRAAGEYVRKTARRFGASLVGIARLDHNWLFSHDLDGRRIDLPRTLRYAVVLAVAMDPEEISKSPGFAASIETGRGYTQMAVVASSLAQALRGLGYRAVSMGNDTALSIPLAIDAGLGQLGRNGLLVTPQHGPCVRLCKVVTDLELEVDEPVDFGLTEYCRRCRRCARACAAEAIDRAPDPCFKTAGRSNNPGILRWAVNHDRCYGFWIENGAECSNCIAACPFTRRRTNARRQS